MLKGLERLYKALEETVSPAVYVLAQFDSRVGLLGWIIQVYGNIGFM